MRTSLLVVAVCAALLGAAIPAHANEPDYDPDFQTFQLHFIDGENKVAFWNITRNVYCTWQAGGSVEDPDVIEGVTLMVHEANGNAFATYQETRPLEIWTLSTDDPCTGTSGEPWAKGYAHASLQDYAPSPEGSHPFSFTFGIEGQGTVVDANGQHWFHSWRFRQFDTSGEQELGTARFTLKPIGS